MVDMAAMLLLLFSFIYSIPFVCSVLYVIMSKNISTAVDFSKTLETPIYHGRFVGGEIKLTFITFFWAFKAHF